MRLWNSGAASKLHLDASVWPIIMTSNFYSAPRVEPGIQSGAIVQQSPPFAICLSAFVWLHSKQIVVGYYLFFISFGHPLSSFCSPDPLWTLPTPLSLSHERSTSVCHAIGSNGWVPLNATTIRLGWALVSRNIMAWV